MIGFEVVSSIVYLAVAYWVLRRKSAFHLGILIGTTTTFAFDWFWSTKSFFNVTFHPELHALPGLVNGSVSEPWVILLHYGFCFTIPLVLLLRFSSQLDRLFGNWHYLIVWLMGVVFVAAYEIPMVHIYHAWTYHQKPEQLFFGFPYSNFFFAGNLIFWPYLFTRCLRDWVTFSPDTGLSLNSRATWKGIVTGVIPVWSGFYLAGAIQLFWYTNTSVWIEAGRPF